MKRKVFPSLLRNHHKAMQQICLSDDLTSIELRHVCEGEKFHFYDRRVKRKWKRQLEAEGLNLFISLLFSVVCRANYYSFPFFLTRFFIPGSPTKKSLVFNCFCAIKFLSQVEQSLMYYEISSTLIVFLIKCNKRWTKLLSYLFLCNLILKLVALETNQQNIPMIID